MAKDRVTVQEAARRLGIKDDAIRKRIQRGTLEHDKDADGRVYVYLDATHDAWRDTTRYSAKDESKDMAHDTTEDGSKDTAKDGALVEALLDQVDYLRGVIETRDRELEARVEEIRRKDHLLAAALERIPELESPRATSRDGQEAPGEQRDGPETASPRSNGGAAPPQAFQEPVEHRSWWRRFFGIE